MKKRYDAYSNYYYHYKQKGKVKSKILAILFCLISIFIVIFFSISFSNFLTISKIVNINTNYIYENKVLYGLSLYQTNKIDDANTFSVDVKKQGGAGYIYLDNMTYYVLSSVYKTNQDAQKVKNNLESNGFTTSVVKIELKNINFKANLSQKSSKVLGESLNLFYENYVSLYNISVEYDKQNIDLIKVKEKYNNLASSNAKKIETFNNYFNSSTNVYILYVKIYLNKLNNIIKNGVNLDESVNVSSFIKDSYCKCLKEYINLYNDML